MKKLRLLCAVSACVITCISLSSNAAIWAEIGEAGDLPATAQQILGTGKLDAISGTISSSPYTHVDMYEIYISGNIFVAAASIPPPPVGAVGFTLQMFLFDSSGVGVYAGQDPNNMSLSYNPSMAGLYYLAISPWNIDPFGPTNYELGINQRIWLEGSSIPDGPAALLPVSDWGGSYSAVSSGYTINLTGAEFMSTVPIPPALWLFSSGLLCLARVARRKKS